MLFMLIPLVNSFSGARRQGSDNRVSSRRVLCGVFTRFIVEKLLSASADDTGKLLFNLKSSSDWDRKPDPLLLSLFPN